jgi:hypothetical protein
VPKTLNETKKEYKFIDQRDQPQASTVPLIAAFLEGHLPMPPKIDEGQGDQKIASEFENDIYAPPLR